MTEEQAAKNRIRAKEWYYANKERKIAYDIEYNKKNREKKNAQSKNWVKNNPVRRKEIVANDYKKHKPQKAAYAKEYGARPEVKAKKREYAKQRNSLPENRKTAIKNKIWRQFKITLEQRDAAIELQKSLCAICYKPETAIHNLTGKVKLLCIDHDHKTNENRGMLCGYCNTLLGYIEKKLDIFDTIPTKIQQYLYAETYLHKKVRLTLKRQE